MTGIKSYFYVCQFSSGDGKHINEQWTSLDYLTEGNNVLVVRMIDNGSKTPLLS